MATCHGQDTARHLVLHFRGEEVRGKTWLLFRDQRGAAAAVYPWLCTNKQGVKSKIWINLSIVVPCGDGVENEQFITCKTMVLGANVKGE